MFDYYLKANQAGKSPIYFAFDRQFTNEVREVYISRKINDEELKWKKNGEFTPGRYCIWIPIEEEKSI